MSIFINISEENKFFLWLPPKTGSKHAEVIFNLFSFQYFSCSYDRTQIFDSSEFIQHGHAMNVFYGHENYQLVCTARNPFNRLISAYIFTSKNIELSVVGFREFFKKNWKNDKFEFWLRGCINLPRQPDYYIRVENMLEDYLKIPFVYNSEVNKIGLLEKLCSKKRNESKRSLILEECYTQDMLDIIYEKFRDHFDKLNYQHIIL